MIRITIDRDSYYAPCCYLLCKVDGDDNWDTRNESTTILVQTDYDYPSIATNFGWAGSDTDIDGAAKFLDDNLGKIIDDPGYFE